MKYSIQKYGLQCAIATTLGFSNGEFESAFNINRIVRGRNNTQRYTHTPHTIFDNIAKALDRYNNSEPPVPMFNIKPTTLIAQSIAAMVSGVPLVEVGKKHGMKESTIRSKVRIPAYTQAFDACVHGAEAGSALCLYLAQLPPAQFMWQPDIDAIVGGNNVDITQVPRDFTTDTAKETLILEVHHCGFAIGYALTQQAMREVPIES